MKRRVICIAATALCMAMTSMSYAKETETATEDDETYYTLEVKRKPYDIEKIASVVLGEDYQRDKEYERYWYNEEGTLEDVKGFCAVADLQEIEKQDFILTPGRYVGIEEVEDDGEPFEEKMTRLTSELSDMFAKSHELEDEIRKKLGAIGYEI